jgi:hypothetical protein
MVAVPAVTPVTIPAGFTVALLLELVQVPPPVALESMIVCPSQTVLSPEMPPGSGNGFTLTVNVAVAVPQRLVTV